MFAEPVFARVAFGRRNSHLITQPELPASRCDALRMQPKAGAFYCLYAFLTKFLNNQGNVESSQEMKQAGFINNLRTWWHARQGEDG
jgi:hypothetical protein